MRKFAMSVVAAASVMIFSGPVAAQEIPVECGESENRPADCADFYPPITEEIPPPTEPATTPPTTEELPPPTLPKTGNGVSSPIQVGTLLLVGGVIVVVATRRRRPADTPS